MKVSGKVAIVTGGARGLGKAYSQGLLERGAKVAIVDVLEKEGKETTSEFVETYGEGSACYVHCDVREQSDVDAMFATVEDKLGLPELVINNAGVAASTLDNWKLMIDVNLIGLMRVTYLALERMRRNNGGKGGVIVNIGSIAGYQVHPGTGSYHASKHGVLGFTGAVACNLEYGKTDHGMRLITMCPHFAKTEMTRRFYEMQNAGVTTAYDELIEKSGGWTKHEDLVRGCMACIEGESHPQGAVVAVSGRGEIYYQSPKELEGKSAV